MVLGQGAAQASATIQHHLPVFWSHVLFFFCGGLLHKAANVPLCATAVRILQSVDRVWSEKDEEAERDREREKVCV